MRRRRRRGRRGVERNEREEERYFKQRLTLTTPSAFPHPPIPHTSLARARKLLLRCTLDMISVRSSESSHSSSSSSRNIC